MQYLNNYNQIFLFSVTVRSHEWQTVSYVVISLVKDNLLVVTRLKLMMFTNLFAASDKPKEIMLTDRYQHK